MDKQSSATRGFFSEQRTNPQPGKPVKEAPITVGKWQKGVIFAPAARLIALERAMVGRFKRARGNCGSRFLAALHDWGDARQRDQRECHSQDPTYGFEAVLNDQSSSFWHVSFYATCGKSTTGFTCASASALTSRHKSTNTRAVHRKCAAGSPCVRVNASTHSSCLKSTSPHPYTVSRANVRARAVSYPHAHANRYAYAYPPTHTHATYAYSN